MRIEGDARDGKHQSGGQQHLQENGVADGNLRVRRVLSRETRGDAVPAAHQRGERVRAVVDLLEDVGMVHALQHGGASNTTQDLGKDVPARLTRGERQGERPAAAPVRAEATKART